MSKVSALHLAKSDSWGTPPEILDMVREVLGGIDLDPCSSAEANERVQAKHYYTREDDGLTRQWFGNVFVNPPGRGLPKRFWSELVTQRINHGIFLAFSLEFLQVGQGAVDDCGLPVPSPLAFPLCVPRKRIRFVGPGQSPTHGNVLIYVPGKTDARDKFAEVFSHLGAVKL